MDLNIYKSLKDQLYTGDVGYFGNYVETKKNIDKKILGAWKAGDITTEQYEELSESVADAIEVAKEKYEQKIEAIRNNKEDKTTIIPDFVTNPQNLADRAARVNYFRNNNKFKGVIDKLTGKTHKFDILWDEFATTSDVDRQQEIIAEMEKMYPASSKAISNENQKGISR